MIEYFRFAVVILAMALATTGLLARAGIKLGALPLVAILRAAVQLAAITLLLRGVESAPWTAALFVILMLSTATFTTARRASGLPFGARAAAAGTLCGALLSLSIILGTGVVAWGAQSVIAVAGIIIGGCMTVSTMALRHYLNNVRAQRGEVEGWLALGARPRESTRSARTLAVRESLIPNLDQTKSTGLVTLPGAFVGALFGGASAVEAAQFQLVVLAGLALGGTVTALAATFIASGAATLPLDEQSSS